MRSSIILTFSFLSVLFAQTKLGSDIDGEAGGDINESGGIGLPPDYPEGK
ncbi:MAG: hypothetical protein QF674_03115 [Candidatus Marinimicrobia bacterium]|jgi:hypothetical protein|nr:hypothetical protein [Candidatus Neomarinimicrobiota bacterium]